MKIFTIGGTALVGPHFIKELFLNNLETVTFNRGGKSFLTEKSFAGDRNNEQALLQAISEYGPDVVVDMIPFTKSSAKLLVKILKKLDKKIQLIALSSIDVYVAYAKINKTEDVDYQSCPLTEDSPIRTLYGPEGEMYDKIGIEREYLSNLEDVTILRLPAIYGWPDTSRIDDFLVPMLKKENMIEMPKERMQWKFSRVLHKNVAFATYLACTTQQTGKHIYNVAEPEAFTSREWCEKIASVVGWKGDLVTKELNEEVDLKQDFYVSSEKIRKELGFYEKYDSEEGLRENIFFSAYQRLNKRYQKEY